MFSKKAIYRRVLLKLSGEALLGPDACVDVSKLLLLAEDILSAHELGVQVAIVIGGGNIVRGATFDHHIDRASADYMGMLATVINGLALREVLEKNGLPSRVLSSIAMPAIAETYVRGRAIRHLEKGRVVIFVAGTGNPYFTTDTAAGLRAMEISADILFKATKVDGIYSEDPIKNPKAIFYSTLSYEKVLAERLNVMDATALCLCRDNKMPIRVFNMNKPGLLKALVLGENAGTLVSDSL